MFSKIRYFFLSNPMWLLVLLGALLGTIFSSYGIISDRRLQAEIDRLHLEATKYEAQTNEAMQHAESSRLVGEALLKQVNEQKAVIASLQEQSHEATTKVIIKKEYYEKPIAVRPDLDRNGVCRILADAGYPCVEPAQ